MRKRHPGDMEDARMALLSLWEGKELTHALEAL